MMTARGIGGVRQHVAALGRSSCQATRASRTAGSGARAAARSGRPCARAPAPQATADSTVSQGRQTSRFGIRRSAAACSTGWCVGPSSPRPMESWVKTKIDADLHQRRHAQRVARVVGEDEEGAAVGDEAAVQRDAVHHRAHAELAHAVEDVVAGDRSGRDRLARPSPWSGWSRSGRPSRRAAPAAPAPAPRARSARPCGWRWSRPSALVSSSRAAQPVVEVLPAARRHAALEFRRLRRELLLRSPRTAAFHSRSARLPASLRVPAVAHGVRDLERRVRPADRLRAWRRFPRRRAARRARRRCWPSSARPCR